MAEGLEPCHIIYENPVLIAIAPKIDHIVAPGHFLVIPKEHYCSFSDMPEEINLAIFHTIRKITGILTREEGYSDYELYSQLAMKPYSKNDGNNWNKEIKHFMYHIIPRKEENENVLFPGPLPQAQVNKENQKHKNYPEKYLYWEQIIDASLKRSIVYNSEPKEELIGQSGGKEQKYPSKKVTNIFKLNIDLSFEKDGSIHKTTIEKEFKIDDNNEDENLNPDFIDIVFQICEKNELNPEHLKIMSEDGHPIDSSNFFLPISEIINVFGDKIVLKEI